MNSEIMQYLQLDGIYILILIVLYIIGMMLKGIPQIGNWLIPFVLLILGIAASVALRGFTLEGILYGVLVAGLTVYGNQLYKQLTNHLATGKAEDQEAQAQTIATAISDSAGLTADPTQTELYKLGYNAAVLRRKQAAEIKKEAEEE